MELYQINTTAFHEEDFLLITDAPYETIEDFLQPIINKERRGEAHYFNYEYVNMLRETFTQHTFIYVDEPSQITF